VTEGKLAVVLRTFMLPVGDRGRAPVILVVIDGGQIRFSVEFKTVIFDHVIIR